MRFVIVTGLSGAGKPKLQEVWKIWDIFALIICHLN